MKSFRQVLQEEKQSKRSSKLVSESLLGKTFAVNQNRKHQAHQSKAVNILSTIQNDCKAAFLENDPEQFNKALLQVLFRFAGALKEFAEMSASNNSTSAIAVMDQESISKEVLPLLKQLIQKK